jgi:hypothetical protein
VLVVALVAIALYQNPGIYKRFALFQSFYIEDDETVVFFPTLGKITEEGGLEVYIHGWIYEDYHHKIVRNMILDGVYKWFGISKDDAILKERVWPFVVDNQSGKRITLYFNSSTPNEKDFLLGSPSSSTGHFKEVIEFSKEQRPVVSKADNLIRFEARSENNTVFTGKSFLLKDKGISIISDIEDTIRISGLRNKTLFFENTFIKPFQAVPSLADLYNHWKKTLANKDVNFHYVNGSPWPFYPLYSKFLKENKFPDGSFHFRNVRIKSAEDAFRGPKDFKIQTIEGKLLSEFPERRFILVGDSSEYDPEVYSQLAKKYPSQIVHVYIRNVNNDGFKDDNLKQRLESVFDGVDSSKWTLFEDSQIRSLLKDKY